MPRIEVDLPAVGAAGLVWMELDTWNASDEGEVR